MLTRSVSGLYRVPRPDFAPNGEICPEKGERPQTKVGGGQNMLEVPKSKVSRFRRRTGDWYPADA
jgi:hypothetical protein